MLPICEDHWSARPATHMLLASHSLDTVNQAADGALLLLLLLRTCQVGYVMQVSGQQLGQDVLECLPDYQLAFDGHCEDGYSAYYQSKCTSQLNHRFGDMMYKIQDLEVRGYLGDACAVACRGTELAACRSPGGTCLCSSICHHVLTGPRNRAIPGMGGH
jgi:hypothetical protein